MHESPAMHATARDRDLEDPALFRDRFHIPAGVAYFCGNSLGLQPLGTARYVNQELDRWARLGVHGHFAEPDPWFSYHEVLRHPAAAIVGAEPDEVVMMNSLTTNLHLLMLSFYRPTAERYRILFDEPIFPSDRYALQSQAALHGFDTADALVGLAPRDGEMSIRLEDIEARLQSDSIAMVLFSGVNFYSGQAHDMAAITRMAHAHGAVCGFDLAHAAGNLELHLHDWNVDFAAWCSYKYLNSGPGGVGGAFVHARHAGRVQPRLWGWWGHRPDSRFHMPERFEAIPGAEAWQLSNAPVLSMAAARASFDIFLEAGMPALRARSVRLTGFLDELLTAAHIEFITPRDAAARGCQLSVRIPHARKVAETLEANGVVCDFREPDVLRMAPVPLYSTYADIERLVDTLQGVLNG